MKKTNLSYTERRDLAFRNGNPQRKDNPLQTCAMVIAAIMLIVVAFVIVVNFWLPTIAGAFK